MTAVGSSDRILVVEDEALAASRAQPFALVLLDIHLRGSDIDGTVRARLDTQRTPQTANNFVVLARYKYYDGTRFFRTDTSIGIIQGGGLSNAASPGYTIADEGGTFTYTPGDLVMARTGQPNSAGAQFFFGVDENVSGLDTQGTYVTFGEVTEGLDVLQAILATNVDDPASGLGGAPDPPVTVNSVRIEET